MILQSLRLKDTNQLYIVRQNKIRGMCLWITNQGTDIITLVHLTVNGEEIVTTVDHPFYVQGRGFVEAGKLLVGDKLLDVNRNVLLVENFDVELTDEPVTVYNFQVEDFHTYHVGENCVLVHNADYDVDIVSKNIKERISNDELNPPTKRGNAPTSKKDGKPIEIHHDNQNPNGPFYEKTQTDHRLGGNYKKPPSL